MSAVSTLYEVKQCPFGPFPQHFKFCGIDSEFWYTSRTVTRAIMEGAEQGSTTQYLGRRQTTPAASENALDHCLVDFGPLQELIGVREWMTELDRIQILEDRGEPRIWLRLIGPGYSLNLQLNAPQPDCFEGTMTATTEPVPEKYRDLAEVKVNNRGCAFVRLSPPTRSRRVDFLP